MQSAQPAHSDATNRPPRAERRRLRWLWTYLKDDRQRHRVLFSTGLVTLGIVGVMGYMTYQTQPLPFDLYTTTGLQGIQLRFFRRVMIWVSRPGYMPWSPLVLLAGALLVGLRLGWRDAAYLMALVFFQGISNHLIKVGIGRPRPADNIVEVLLPNSGNSFPSGHVMFYTVFFGFLFFLAWSRLRRSWPRTIALLLTGAMVLLIGPSRIVLGAHWLSDVVAGHLLALVILLFGIEIYIHYFAPSRGEVVEKA